MNDKIQLLSLDYDLTHESEQELTATMMEVCAIYIECVHGISTETGEARIRVEYVAEEIIRRRDAEAARKEEGINNGRI